MGSENYMQQKFINTERTFIVKRWSFFKILKKMLSSENAIPHKRFNFENPSILKDFKRIESDLKISWLGHSTILMEMNGSFILTDPVWGKRVSPLSFAGPKRFFAPPVSFENLPEIEAVIISHDHYDHLDRQTIKKLKNLKIGRYLVPSGLKEYLVQWGVPEEKIEEFKWWDDILLGSGLKITATPSKHFSGRSMLGRNTTLWASWVIEKDGVKVFFSGDSGYTRDFKEIGDKFGPFDLVCMESGAYDELWPDIHMGPENAVKAFNDLKGENLLPIHWGTFKLASHPWYEPVEKLIKLSRRRFRLIHPAPGKVVSLGCSDNDESENLWWRK